ncbi:nicotinate-nucleotide--dimethylbenzimidazole phosphoribosyltransferase [Streptomyces sp. NEAU-S77]|uniref:nicotinate-nucleotide--dimethylbenzimidazole phosphoribosyltransferase n=1 Tax=Streptomyces sp. NEAU-S77 TaxID=3411033 RepID=UPI003B9EA1CE
MTDTGQVPGEGLPENAGGRLGQPHPADVHAPPADAGYTEQPQPGVPPGAGYTFLDGPETGGEEDDLLLMPGAQGAWSEQQAQYDPQAPYDPQNPYDQQAQYEQQMMQAPMQQPYPQQQGHGLYEGGVLDPGMAAYADAQMPEPQPVAEPLAGPVEHPAPEQPVQQQPAPQPPQAPAAPPTPPRRPLHMGPPVPDHTSGSGIVRSLADRGPAAARNTAPPVQQPQQAPPPEPEYTGGVDYASAPEYAAGPQYFATQPQPDDPGPLPGPQLADLPQIGDAPPPGDAWDPQPPAPMPAPAETVGLGDQPLPPEGAQPAAMDLGYADPGYADQGYADPQGGTPAPEPGQPVVDIPAQIQPGIAPDQLHAGPQAVIPAQIPHDDAETPQPYADPTAVDPGHAIVADTEEQPPPADAAAAEAQALPPEAAPADAQAPADPAAPGEAPVPEADVHAEPADGQLPAEAEVPEADGQALAEAQAPAAEAQVPADPAAPGEAPVPEDVQVAPVDGQVPADGQAQAGPVAPDAAPAEADAQDPSAPGEAQAPEADAQAAPTEAQAPMAPVAPGEVPVPEATEQAAPAGAPAEPAPAEMPVAEAPAEVDPAAADVDSVPEDADGQAQAGPVAPDAVPAEADAQDPSAPTEAQAPVDPAASAEAEVPEAATQGAPAEAPGEPAPAEMSAEEVPATTDPAAADGQAPTDPAAPGEVPVPEADAQGTSAEAQAPAASVAPDAAPAEADAQDPSAPGEAQVPADPGASAEAEVPEAAAQAAPAEAPAEPSAAEAPAVADPAAPGEAPVPEAEGQAVPAEAPAEPAAPAEEGDPEAEAAADAQAPAPEADAAAEEASGEADAASDEPEGETAEAQDEAVGQEAPDAEATEPEAAAGSEATASEDDPSDASEAQDEAAEGEATTEAPDAGTPAEEPEQAEQSEQADAADHNNPEADPTDQEPANPEAADREAADPEAADPEAAEDPAAAPGPLANPFGPRADAGYDDAERAAVHRVMRERRDIRNGFRPDPIPHEVLLRVLEAAHTAPSVGQSQPWDFVVIRSEETRRTMHELAARQRDAYAKSLPKGRAKQFKELKIEAILETPINIVVTADPTRGGRHTLGRHTQPQMAPYSSALAVENLWLAARAEGLGVGWVSFFDEREMVRTLGLPDHLEAVAYLCVGYVDEFPEEPELLRAGWSKRRPLSWVVHEETYGRRALPGEDPHNLLTETLQGIRPLDAKALGEAWERQKRMTKPSGALGMLEIISAQLSGLSRQCPPPIPEPAAVAIFAGDHGVHAQGVTAWPQEVTGQMVANFLGGGAVCNAFASQVGAEVCVVDVGVTSELPSTPGLLPRKVRAGTGDFTTGPALTREEVLRALEVGIETARDLVAAGNKALLTGEMGIANTTTSAALVSVYTGADPAEVTGRGTGINDEMHARKIDVVRRGLELHQPDPADPIGVLCAFGGLEHAAMAGLLLGGASLRTPVILDGVSAGAAALVARAIAPEVLAACIAGHRSAEPGHVAALNKLGLRPLVDLDLRLGEGTGALLALPVVQSAARAMHEVATFDSAGVTEKN